MEDLQQRVVASGTREVHPFPAVFVYPNPASDRIGMSSNFPHGGLALDFRLFDVTGKAVNGKLVPAGTEMDLDVSGLAPGMYFYTVMAQGKVVRNGKLVIAR